MRTIHEVRPITETHWVGDGFPVRNFFSPRGGEPEFLSPYLLLDYMGPFDVPASNERKGVDEHPHRGFETVTLMFKGEVEHRDSAGHSGKVTPGDVQWMTAASGVVHEEKHSQEFTTTGGMLEGVQLWVNLPTAQKMSSPKYQEISGAKIPKIELKNGAGFLRVVAGSYEGQAGPAFTFTPLNLWDLDINGEVAFDIPSTQNLAIAILDGRATINGKGVEGPALVVFGHEGSKVAINASSQAHLLVLSGEPIKEPMFAHGPFVMNTYQEISEAINDYQAGKMGRLS